MPDERIVTFPWGVDLRHFSPPEVEGRRAAEHTNNAAQPFVLLSVRSWEPIYGVDVIARAFVQAARQIPELQPGYAGQRLAGSYAAPDLPAGRC